MLLIGREFIYIQISLHRDNKVVLYCIVYIVGRETGSQTDRQTYRDRQTDTDRQTEMADKQFQQANNKSAIIKKNKRKQREKQTNFV